MAKKKADRKKKAGVNKSQAIRDYIAKHRNAKAANVVENLGKEGVMVTAPLVYQQMNKTKKGRKKATRRGAANGKVAVDDLLAAKKLADNLGGIEKAKAALKVLEELG